MNGRPRHPANLVDWLPWGEEALANARGQDRPILLSIGYSACPGCHPRSPSRKHLGSTPGSARALPVLRRWRISLNLRPFASQVISARLAY
ncbi:MAG: DUF255 domain-containing protein [Rhodocyclaceae bacterium]